MLQATLLAALLAAPLGSVALFVPGRLHVRGSGIWPAVRRFTLAIVGTIVVAAACAGLLRLLGVSEHNLVTGIAGLIVASLIWLPVTRRWSARAHLCWASSVFLFVVYLTYALDWTFASHLGPASTIGGFLLWLLEVFAALLCCAYLWEICDALGTERWRRRITPTALFGFAGIAAALTKYDQLSGPLLAGLLLFPTLGMAATPVNSWAARRAALPAWLRERRRTDYRRDRRAFAAGVATGGAVAVLDVAIAAIALLFTGHQVQSPNLVGPAQGSSSSAPATPSRSPSSTPSSTPSGTTSPSPSTSPAATSSATPSPTSSPSPATSPTPTATPTP